MNESWKINFHRPILVECKNESCSNMVKTTNTIAASQGAVCDTCRKEARTIYDHNYYLTVGKRKRQQRRTT